MGTAWLWLIGWLVTFVWGSCLWVCTMLHFHQVLSFNHFLKHHVMTIWLNCFENLTTTEHHYGKILFDGNGEKVNLTGIFFPSKVEAHLLFHLKKFLVLVCNKESLSNKEILKSYSGVLSDKNLLKTQHCAMEHMKWKGEGFSSDNRFRSGFYSRCSVVIWFV